MTEGLRPSAGRADKTQAMLECTIGTSRSERGSEMSICKLHSVPRGGGRKKPLVVVDVDIDIIDENSLVVNTRGRQAGRQRQQQHPRRAFGFLNKKQANTLSLSLKVCKAPRLASVDRTDSGGQLYSDSR